MCSAATLRSKQGLVRTNTSAEVYDRTEELRKMNESVQILLSQGGPGAADVAAQMQEVLENALKASLSAKNAVQQELDDLYAVGYNGCDTALTEAETSSGAVAAKQASFETTRDNHKDCRTVEAESKTAFDSCAEEEAELKKAKEAACNKAFRM